MGKGKEGKGEGRGEKREGKDAHGPRLELRADELGHGEEGHALDLHDGGRVEVARAGLAGGEDLDLRAGGGVVLWLWERECELKERRGWREGTHVDGGDHAAVGDVQAVWWEGGVSGAGQGTRWKGRKEERTRTGWSTASASR